MKTHTTIDVDQECLDHGIIESSVSGDVHQMKYLLDRGGGHAKKDSALCRAAENGHLEVVCLLLDSGANIHTGNDYALRCSVECGYLNVVELLIERGASIHTEDGQALRLAAERGYLEMVSLLLDSGADAPADNDRALRQSVTQGHSDVVLLLLEHGANLEAGIEEAVTFRKSKMLDLLNRVKLSREEKKLLLMEIPGQVSSGDRIRM